MKALVPFYVITAIVLVAFMSMYNVQHSDDIINECLNNTEKCECDEDEPEPGNFCTYAASFYNVFGYLAGGPDGTTDPLDMIFIFLTVIIFLNVLIAIVSNAW
jgi:hypothetical protein